MKTYMCIAVVLCTVCTSLAADFQRGSGTPDDPYQIGTAQQLIDMGQDPNLMDKHYILINDIELDPNLPDGRVFDRAVIAPDTDPDDEFSNYQGTPFSGVFDGNDYAIRNLSIIGKSNLGLFGRIKRGTVLRLGLDDVFVEGTGPSVGGLAAYVSLGSIINCYVTGIVSTSGSYVGGLVGDNGGEVTLSFSSCTVKGKHTVGGLVGWNSEEGLAQCYSMGEVHGEDRVGGLAGINGHSFDGGIADSFSTSAVFGVSSVGGLVGSNEGDILNSHSVGVIQGSEQVGGLVGEENHWIEQPTTINCFWDIESSGTATSAGGTGLPTSQMQDPNTYLAVGWDFTDEIGNGNREIWQVSSDTTHPVLSAFYGYEPMKSGGLGTADNPYLVTTVHEFACIWFHPEAYYLLREDIDLAEKVWSDSIVPIFGGKLDGGGHVLRNFQMEVSQNPEVFMSDWDLGLIGTLESDAIIEDLTLADVSIMTEGHYVGAMVGYSHGSIEDCHSTGMVKGKISIGGLVGRIGTGSVINSSSSVSVSAYGTAGGLVGSNEAGSVICSFSTGDVNGRVSIGGLIGHHKGFVDNCFSSGAASGETFIGGLVGNNDTGRIEHSYSAAIAIGTRNNFGGLVGRLSSGCVNQCFWDTNVSGQASSAGGIGRPSAKMMKADTFLWAGWDFIGEDENGTEDIWWIDEGNDYPRLWWELPPEE